MRRHAADDVAFRDDAEHRARRVAHQRRADAVLAERPGDAQDGVLGPDRDDLGALSLQDRANDHAPTSPGQWDSRPLGIESRLRHVAARLQEKHVPQPPSQWLKDGGYSAAFTASAIGSALVSWVRANSAKRQPRRTSASKLPRSTIWPESKTMISSASR